MQQHKVETQIVHEEQILEAIDQLRRRKARPDADRICNYLLRKYAVDARDTIADLHRLIEAEKVIQVDYKGNTSYRNASKWSRLQLYKNRPDAFTKDKLNFSVVNGSFSELIFEDPDRLNAGVPPNRLVEHMLEGMSSPASRKLVEDFLHKEVSSGNIEKLANGNYNISKNENLKYTGNPKKRKLNSENDNRRYSSETSDEREKLMKDGNSPEYEYNETGNGDSRSNTPRSSRHTSPRIGITNGHVAVAVKEPDSPEESSTKDDGSSRDVDKSAFDEKKRDSKGDDGSYSNLKRSSKSERKQRLQVRADDSMDLEIKFEDFEKNSSKRNRDTDEQYSEDNKEEDDAGRSSTNPSPTPSNTVGGFRSARRKRAKKVFDPSDNNVVKRKRGRQPGSGTKNVVSLSQEYLESPPKLITKDGPNRHCSLCAKDKSEGLVACRDCTVRAHPSCIYSPEEMITKSGFSWQCERCKTCTVCCETSDAGPLVTCTNCDDAYHHTCHAPRIPSKPSSKWKCCNCSDKHTEKPVKIKEPKEPKEMKEPKEVKESKEPKEIKEIKEVVLGVASTRPDELQLNSPVLPPVLSPQVSPSRGSIEHIDEDHNNSLTRDVIDPNIPDASDWTSEQVYQYFARLFPKEAEVFRVQDIDGHSLLLMKRSDVLIGMDLLLGPALKIYRHVLKLQMRRDDTRFYWL